jgi:hypothetical protein
MSEKNEHRVINEDRSRQLEAANSNFVVISQISSNNSSFLHEWNINIYATSKFWIDVHFDEVDCVSQYHLLHIAFWQRRYIHLHDQTHVFRKSMPCASENINTDVLQLNTCLTSGHFATRNYAETSLMTLTDLHTCSGPPPRYLYNCSTSCKSDLNTNWTVSGFINS